MRWDDIEGLYGEWRPDADFELWAQGLTGEIFTLWHDDRIVGMFHGLVFQSPEVPHTRMIGDSFYVTPKHRRMAGRLWKYVGDYCANVGVGRAMMVGYADMVEFWERHRFTIGSYIMERNL